MKIIDANGSVLGRLASYAAKESLKGEEIIILNCNNVIISGNKENIKGIIHKKRGRFGSSQKGPTYSRTSERMVKRAIRGMLPNYREGRGRIAFKKIKCYSEIPKEFENSEKIKIAQDKKIKSIEIKDLLKEIKN